MELLFIQNQTNWYKQQSINFSLVRFQARVALVESGLVMTSMMCLRLGIEWNGIKQSEEVLEKIECIIKNYKNEKNLN